MDDAYLELLMNDRQQNNDKNIILPKGETIHTKLVGVTFDDCQVNIMYCRTGELLDLIREPENKYDPNAIRVERAGQKLGYISREQASALVGFIDNKDYNVCCLVEQITGGGAYNYGVNIAITVAKKPVIKKGPDEYTIFDMDKIMSDLLDLFDVSK